MAVDLVQEVGVAFHLANEQQVLGDRFLDCCASARAQRHGTWTSSGCSARNSFTWSVDGWPSAKPVINT